jgi:FtsP/CotA-like multicopper oxidase with cupredoxin domain
MDTASGHRRRCEEMNRRTFLKSAVGATLALGLPGSLVAYATGKKAEKAREFRFSASKTRVSLGTGDPFWAWTYNGQVPGPEIRVKEGETVRVFLKNYLPEETSIHWHGVPVPNAMDGVPGVTQRGVGPGEDFVYEFVAKPAGTYFYHSHARYQLDQGLYGPLIIEPVDQVGTYDHEYTLMLEDWVMRDGGGIAATAHRRAGGMMGGMMGGRGRFSGGEEPLLDPFYDAYAVNGRVYWAMEPLTVNKGDRVKLRLVNASSATIYDLRLAGHALTVTHADGNPVTPIETDVIRIGMGERYDVSFLADNPGLWLLAARENGLGEGRLRVPIRYRGVLAKRPVEPEFRGRLRFVSYPDFESLDPLEGGAAPDVVFPQVLSGGMHSSYWTINGQVYPYADSLPVRRGERVRISYVNRSMMPHPMHLHGHSFRVVNPGLPPTRWVLKDTILVYPMERVEVELLADNPGRWFHHCHNLYHMNAGMANLVVYQTR